MERIEAELFTDGGNDAVVRMPARRFPGVVVQGDSLHILRGDVAEVAEACERGDLDEARDSAGLLLANLDALLARYEAALDEHEIPRPYGPLRVLVPRGSPLVLAREWDGPRAVKPGGRIHGVQGRARPAGSWIIACMTQGEHVLRLADLRRACSVLLDEAERRFGHELDLSELPVDYYWSLDVAAAFDMSETPTAQLACGQVGDDVAEIAALVRRGPEDVIALWHDLDHLAGVVRLLAHLDLPR